MIADSRVWVHIPLPAVRPRQRSWGTSLPQSVVLSGFILNVIAHSTCPLVCGATNWRNGNHPVVTVSLLCCRFMSNHVGPMNGHMFRDFTGFLTHSRLRAVERGPSVTSFGP